MEVLDIFFPSYVDKIQHKWFAVALAHFSTESWYFQLLEGIFDNTFWEDFLSLYTWSQTIYARV